MLAIQGLCRHIGLNELLKTTTALQSDEKITRIAVWCCLLF